MAALIGAIFWAVACAQNIINLGGSDWQLSNGINVSTTGSLPSQAHLDLFAAGIIDDPLKGDNDVQQLWVQRSNWTYSKSVDVSKNETTWLVFDGLDTFAQIELCDQTVGNADNQFRQFYYNVTEVLQGCEDPVLTLNFGSATKIVLDLAKTGDPLLNSANGVNGKEFQGKIYARKEQNDFGWDWSPSFAPAGPWRPARIVQPQDFVYVRNALIDIYREGQMNNIPPDQSKPWIFNASIDILGDVPDKPTMLVVLADSKDSETSMSFELCNVYSNNETITGSAIIDPSKVKLWWPNGMGDQSLYNATITIGDGKKDFAAINRKVGFRTIVLNLTPISDEQLALGIAPGSNWHFEVNGHEFYAKGSNLIPPDVFWPRVNETKMQHLFQSVVGANMNMLRVWSSGAYLPDWIYDLADEAGILLWSEFEFSDAEYPTNSSYLADYEAEAYYNVRRVNHHPSVALWAGGNELEAVILAFFFNSPLKEQYELIFQEVLIKCVYANTRSISYIPSSTYNGYLSLDFNSTRPQIPRYNNMTDGEYYSDIDSYNYNASQAFDLSVYPVGRFADEFGFHSMPSLPTWQEVIPSSELSFDSYSVLHRNRHVPFGTADADAAERAMQRNQQQPMLDDDTDPLAGSRAGIKEMTDAVKLWYPEPHKSDPIANFSAWAWSTQVFQADYYANQIAFYRRGSGMKERQLGSLYWQLEDVWAAPTWASIEANGRHKVSYYSAKDIFSPVIIRPYFDYTTNRLEVWATSDQWMPVSGTAKLEWTDWQGNHLNISAPSDAKVSNSTNGTFEVPFEVGAINTTHILTYPDISSLFSASNSTNPTNSTTTASNALLRLSLTATTSNPPSPPSLTYQSRIALPSSSSSSQPTTFTHYSYFHPLPLSQTTLIDPSLSLSYGSPYPDHQTFFITATNGVAAWVWLEYPRNDITGWWEDNGFWLAAGEERNVVFWIWENWTGDANWVTKVTVRSMYDNLID